MLVLSRKQGESVVIGDALVTVLAVQRGRIKLGVAAPEDTLIVRAELLTKPQEASDD